MNTFRQMATQIVLVRQETARVELEEINQMAEMTKFITNINEETDK